MEHKKNISSVLAGVLAGLVISGATLGIVNYYYIISAFVLVTITALKYDIRYALVSSITMFFAMAFLLPMEMAITWMWIAGLTSGILGSALKSGRIDEGLLRGSVFLALSLLAVLVIQTKYYGVDVLRVFNEMVSAQFTQVGQFLPLDTATVINTLNEYFVALIFASAFMLMMFVIMITKFINFVFKLGLRRLDFAFVRFERMGFLQLLQLFLVAYLISMMMNLSFQVVAFNLIIILSMFYAVQGFGVISYLLRSRFKAILPLTMIGFFTIIYPIFGSLLAMVGFFDNTVNIRKL